MGECIVKHGEKIRLVYSLLFLKTKTTKLGAELLLIVSNIDTLSPFSQQAYSPTMMSDTLAS